MRKQMLFILSTLALLIYPLSVSAQSSFSFVAGREQCSR